MGIGLILGNIAAAILGNRELVLPIALPVAALLIFGFYPKGPRWPF